MYYDSDDDYFYGDDGAIVSDDYDVYDDVADLLRLERLRHQVEFQFFRGATAFIKDWSSKRGDGNQQVVSISDKNTFTEKFATFFNYRDDGLADLLIGAKGGPKVHAHQVVVAGWSEKLKEIMFQENFTRSLTQLGTSTLELEVNHDLLLIELNEGEECSAVFQDVITFMYTESISLNLETAWPIMELAAKYSVSELLDICHKFIHQRVEEISLGHCMENFMNRAFSLGVSKGLVQLITKRFLRELFVNDSTIVSSLSVDLLCDILRSSDVVAMNEFEIYLKLKPKLNALKEAGEHRQVIRLLSLIRLTQMTSSELGEVISSEYMEEIRRTFPGKLETALWTRALYAEHPEHEHSSYSRRFRVLQTVDEIPFNMERPRLYWKCPLHLNHEEDDSFMYDMELYSHVQKLKSDSYRDITVAVRNGHQQVEQGPYNHRRDAFSFPVYQVSNGQHGLVKLGSKLTLEVPKGNFSSVTVRLIFPRTYTVMFKIVLIFYKRSQGQLTSEPRVYVLEGRGFPREGVTYPVDTLTTSEDFDVTVRVFGYAFDRAPHYLVNNFENFGGSTL